MSLIPARSTFEALDDRVQGVKDSFSALAHELALAGLYGPAFAAHKDAIVQVCEEQGWTHDEYEAEYQRRFLAECDEAARILYAEAA